MDEDFIPEGSEIVSAILAFKVALGAVKLYKKTSHQILFNYTDFKCDYKMCPTP